jgi:hypothetical protein
MDSKNKAIIVIFIIFIIAAIAILQGINYFITNAIYKKFFNIISIAILINIFIFIFMIYTFSDVKLAPGPPGPKGNRGKQGYEGAADLCGMCGKQDVSLRYKKNDDAKINTVIIENPLLGKPPSMEDYETVVLKNGCMSNKCVYSSNKNYKVCQQADGLFVLYNNITNTTIWKTDKYGGSYRNGKLCMQADGNLVNYDVNNNAYWSSNTSGSNNSLVLSDNGNLRIRNSNNEIVWDTNTGGR